MLKLAVGMPCLVTASCPAQDPAVANVLGQDITARDLAPPKDMLDARAKKDGPEKAQAWANGARVDALRGLILAALAERFAKDHHLEVTDAEIETFNKSMSGSNNDWLKESRDRLRKQIADPKLDPAERKKAEANLKRTEAQIRGEDWPHEDERKEMAAKSEQIREQLKAPDLVVRDRKRLEQDLAYNTRFQNLDDATAAKEWPKYKRELERQVAEPFIRTWKMHRELYTQHKGRVIFQQAGIEPIDAVRAWLEASEKAGDFAILDAGLKEGFWSYWKRDQPFALEKPTGHEFDKPWWTDPPRSR